MKPFVLGLDIGYSNLKLTMGFKDAPPATRVFPAGAAPCELLPRQLSGDAGDGTRVVIDGEHWVAAVAPARLQGWERELHDDYPATNAYKALFHAALLMAGQKEIDVLVTGLPVARYLETQHRDSLRRRLGGEHRITPRRSVTVKLVMVVPQPAGAYLDAVASISDEGLLERFRHGKTVVIDPGFFSVDWVALEEGEIRYRASGTSLKAMSVLLRETARLIREDHGAAPAVEKLEKALHGGEKEIFLYGEKIAVAGYCERAAEKVTHNALVAMRKSMREDGMDADVVLLAGGGATAYREAVRALFPKSAMLVRDDPVAANARGFWQCG